MILDTTFLVDVLRGKESVRTAKERVDNAEPVAVSTISIMELWEGVHYTDAAEEEIRKVRTLLADLQEMPFDRACAIEAGAISATLKETGQEIESADVMIAATARANNVPVVTRNVDHFERVKGIDILAY